MTTKTLACPKCRKEMTEWRPIVLLSGNKLVVRCPHCAQEIAIGTVSAIPTEGADLPGPWSGEVQP